MLSFWEQLFVEGPDSWLSAIIALLAFGFVFGWLVSRAARGRALAILPELLAAALFCVLTASTGGKPLVLLDVICGLGVFGVGAAAWLFSGRRPVIAGLAAIPLVLIGLPFWCGLGLLIGCNNFRLCL